MPPKKELCRNFQRGYCQYGERCRFLHANQQQAKPNSNPFGFGTQNASQPQKPNPFGFGGGTQNTTQPQKPNPFGFGVQNNSNSNQFKPGENKWSRFAPNSGTQTQSAPQKQDAHVCTDSASCKRQFSEDFQHEKPLWKLTCYGHCKYGPCDIIGDVSYEELQASAYEDAKRGTNIQSIVEKERSLLNAKLIEFENLLRNPYTPQSNLNLNTQNTLSATNTNIFPQPTSNLNTQNTFPGTNTNIFTQPVQNNAPPAVSSFNQLNSTIYTGFQMSAPASNNAFAQVNQFQAPTQKNSFGFGNQGQLGVQPSTQLFSNLAQATTPTFPNAFPTATSPNLNLSSQQPSMPNVVPASIPSVQNTQNIQHSSNSEDNSIWLKDEWRAGEIPEEAPPAGVIF
ncbi:zinc finger CCCH domain-containing protein 46-like [Bidens hawaiensis]|uniref:zinc finger CCCH domain-containing protein 46-like n=1 Tax=Bidens hawaiensis TaxID=980011 RepID=UPI00404ADADC